MSTISSATSSLSSIMDTLSDVGSNTSEVDATLRNYAAKQYLSENDADGDGKLTNDEVTLSKEAFEQLDADADGYLTKDEMAVSLTGQENAVYQAMTNGNVKLFQYQAVSTLFKVL